MNNLSTIFNDIAKALQDKGISEKLKPTEMATGISTIEVGKSKYGSNVDTFYNCEDGILSYGNTKQKLSFDNVSAITQQNVLAYKFYGNTGIEEISFPELTAITGNHACQYMIAQGSSGKDSFTKFYAPSLVCISAHNIFTNAFQNTQLSTVHISSLQEIVGNSIFANAFANTKLTYIDLPNLTTIKGQQTFNNGFNACNTLLLANLSAVSVISGSSCCQNMFYSCRNLSSVNFDSLEYIYNDKGLFNAFQNCDKLISVSFPNLKAISAATDINNPTFGSNPFGKIKDIYLSSLTAITNTYVFKNNYTSLSAIHFSKTNENLLTATAGYTGRWGAPTTCLIKFDL